MNKTSTMKKQALRQVIREEIKRLDEQDEDLVEAVNDAFVRADISEQNPSPGVNPFFAVKTAQRGDELTDSQMEVVRKTADYIGGSDVAMFASGAASISRGESPVYEAVRMNVQPGRLDGVNVNKAALTGFQKGDLIGQIDDFDVRGGMLYGVPAFDMEGGMFGGTPIFADQNSEQVAMGFAKKLESMLPPPPPKV